MKAADAIVVLHLAFVIFVALGGFLVLRWRWIVWLHVPAVLWGVAIEFGGRICPLTPLENSLRLRNGTAGYEGDFVAHYVVPVLYPAGLTHQSQLILGALALGINLLVYARNLLRFPHRHLHRSGNARPALGSDEPEIDRDGAREHPVEP